MTYRDRGASRDRDRLYHWAVIRLLPNAQSLVVARFQVRSDIVIFDPIGEDKKSDS